MTTVTSVETVTLKGGFVIALEVLQLAWRLEESGIELLIAGPTKKLYARPRNKVTPHDVAQIRRHAVDLKRLIKYGDRLNEREF
jgi:hypothetical protein